MRKVQEMDIRAQLAQAGRAAVDGGLVVGSGGNLSARQPGSSEFVLTNSGAWLDRLDDTSFSALSVDSDQVPSTATPSVEWRLHQLTYRARPDVNAIVHLHPQLLLLLDAAQLPVRQVTTDHCYYLGDIATVGYHHPGSPELATSTAAAADNHDVVVMSRHGCSTLGEDVDMALRRALNLNEAAVLTYQSVTLGCGPEINFPEKDRRELTGG